MQVKIRSAELIANETCAQYAYQCSKDVNALVTTLMALLSNPRGSSEKHRMPRKEIDYLSLSYTRNDSEALGRLRHRVLDDPLVRGCSRDVPGQSKDDDAKFLKHYGRLS